MNPTISPSPSPLPPDSEQNLPLAIRRPWYTRPWRVFGVFALTIALVLGGAFAAQVFQIKGDLERGTFDFSRITDEYGTQVTARENTPAASNVEKVNVSADDDAFLGPADASVVIIGFEDFECPFSRQAFPEIREVMAKYQDRVKFVYRDFPNTTTHEGAQAAALAAECAGDQGKFWEMHDKLFVNQPQFSEAQLKGYAKELGLSTVVFNRCFDEAKHISEIQQDLQAGLEAGANGTPTWFVNGYRITGPIPSDTWEQIIESFL